MGSWPGGSVNEWQLFVTNNWKRSPLCPLGWVAVAAALSPNDFVVAMTLILQTTIWGLIEGIFASCRDFRCAHETSV